MATPNNNNNDNAPHQQYNTSSSASRAIIRSRNLDNTNPRNLSGDRRHQGTRRDGRSGGRGHFTHHARGSYEDGRRGSDRIHADRGRGGRGNDSNNLTNPSPMATDGLPQPVGPYVVPYPGLPPFLPGSASLIEQLDQRLLVVLRDGRHLVGTLRTFDQFANMVLEGTSERRILVVRRKDGDDCNDNERTVCYQTDIELGLFILRGDVVVLMGEVEDNENQEELNPTVTFVSLEEFERLEEEDARRREDTGDSPEEIDWDFDLDLVA